ncbi:ubiquitin-conjugating enzyme E2 35-like [Thrips palmi]|uniref:Ubiquitin-conjugating enzyme E2 35-like n=1 Tax=Thrips palmi TaxID=161013 RepID=A0A6P8ZYL3_THRPL|nr:ubiquitin-conjugating enzyme E2 35-like [Thrips palmi]
MAPEPTVNMQRRIMRDITDISKMESDYILIDGDHLNYIKVVITGPPSSPFEGGIFEVTLDLHKFPAKPPKVVFETPVFHPNICPYEGKVCMNILNPTEWAPATRLVQILEAARSLLDQPNAASPLNGSAACMLRMNQNMYVDTIRAWTHVFAGGDGSRVPQHMLDLMNQATERLHITKAKALRLLTRHEWIPNRLTRRSSEDESD